MGLRMIEGRCEESEDDVVVLYCSITGIAFGPVIAASDEMSAREHAESFLKWCRERKGIKDLRAVAGQAVRLWEQFVRSEQMIGA